jgi:hypothetical protein
LGLDETSLPDGIVTPDQLRHTTNWPDEPEFGDWALAAYQAVQDALPVLLPLLEEADDRLRRETAHLLAWFPSFAPASLPRLRGRLPLEAERDTMVTMVVAVGLLAGATGQTSDTLWLSKLLGGPDPVLRWAAATALARLLPEHPPEPAVQELLWWLTEKLGPRRLPTPGRHALRRVHAPDPGPARPGRPPARRRGAAGQAARCFGLGGRAAALELDGGRLQG